LCSDTHHTAQAPAGFRVREKTMTVHDVILAWSEKGAMPSRVIAHA
jgi:hypothetical protein